MLFKLFLFGILMTEFSAHASMTSDEKDYARAYLRKIATEKYADFDLDNATYTFGPKEYVLCKSPIEFEGLAGSGYSSEITDGTYTCRIYRSCTYNSDYCDTNSRMRAANI